MMEITAEQIVAVLNERAATDPLIKEIMRSAVYEVVVKIQQAQAEQAAETQEDGEKESPELVAVPDEADDA